MIKIFNVFSFPSVNIKKFPTLRTDTTWLRTNACARWIMSFRSTTTARATSRAPPSRKSTRRCLRVCRMSTIDSSVGRLRQDRRRGRPAVRRITGMRQRVRWGGRVRWIASASCVYSWRLFSCFCQPEDKFLLICYFSNHSNFLCSLFHFLFCLLNLYLFKCKYFFK